MRIGVTQMIDGRPGRGREFIEATAIGMERRGFASFWGGDHIVFFQRYDSQYPSGGLGEAGFHQDQGLYEPTMTLLVAALATTELRVGLSVDVLPERNPVVRARDIATLDNLSGGRVDYGVGIGWAREEYAAVGVPYADRGARCDDYLAAMKTLWHEPVASHHGPFLSFDDVLAYPKPVQRPHPPILVGGNTPAALRRAARLGDGWFGWGITVHELDACLEELDAQLWGTGRARDEMRVLVGLPHDGDLDTLQDYVAACAQRGVDEVVVGIGLSRKRYDDQLDAYALALRAWLG